MSDVARAVERLTQPHTEVENGHPVEWPPLLEWLEQSIHEVTGRTGGSGDGGAPFNEDALRLKKRITKRLKLIYDALYMPWTPNLIQATEAAWRYAQEERNGGRMDDQQWEMIGEEFINWVQRIEAEDNRPMSLPLDRCPRCSVSRVYPARDSDGERIYLLDPQHHDDPAKPAVVIEWDEGRAPVGECRSPECDGYWVGWQAVANLGFTLGATQDLAVLSACGITLDLTQTH